MFLWHFSFSQTSIRVSITQWKHGTCFLFLNYFFLLTDYVLYVEKLRNTIFLCVYLEGRRFSCLRYCHVCSMISKNVSSCTGTYSPRVLVTTLNSCCFCILHLFYIIQAREMMENCSIEDPNNDDKILQCCLLFQRKGTEINLFCLLFTFIAGVIM